MRYFLVYVAGLVIGTTATLYAIYRKERTGPSWRDDIDPDFV